MHEGLDGVAAPRPHLLEGRGDLGKIIEKELRQVEVSAPEGPAGSAAAAAAAAAAPPPPSLALSVTASLPASICRMTVDVRDDAACHVALLESVEIQARLP